MKINEYVLGPAAELDIVKTFECGQCFRWNADENGVYRGVVRGVPAAVWQEGQEVHIGTAGSLDMWIDYFDLNTDYEAASVFNGGEYLDTCIKFGRGIRILRQEPWEALCSFIISQCNNIPRIKSIIERLCTSFGDKIDFMGAEMFSFPSAEKLAELNEADLAFLRAGYRAPYIINAAKAVSCCELDLNQLVVTDWISAKKELLKIKGIGEKVANCVVLFGLYHMEAFPVDTWIKKALKEHFPPDFDPETLGKYAGLAQQYIFYYARTNGV